MGESVLQYVGLAFTVITFFFVTVAVILASRLNGSAPYSIRIALFMAWLLSGLAMYSSSSFLWAGDLDDATLDVLRFLPLGVRTIILILAISLVGYYIQIIRRRER